MLERNLLSHLKLALLLSLLSSAVLLQTRLVPEPVGVAVEPLKTGLPIASVLFAGCLFAIVAGAWEYRSGYRDLIDMRVFLVGTKHHLAIMTTVTAVVLTACIVLLADNEL